MAAIRQQINIAAPQRLVWNALTTVTSIAITPPAASRRP